MVPGATVSSVDDWARMFEAATGIKVSISAPVASRVKQRFDQEVKAGRSRSAQSALRFRLMTDWANDGVIDMKAPRLRYPTELRMPGFWTPLKAMVSCMAYNADIISHDEAPTLGGSA